MEKYLITINQKLFNEYRLHYFKANPRCKKFPFDKKTKVKKVRYNTLSLNELLPINSRVYATIKKNWGDFGVWVAKKYKLEGKQLDNCLFELRFYAETKAKRDNDNAIGGYKIFSDGFTVDSGFLIDDNYNHLNPIITSCHYDKDNPRLEIRITSFGGEKDVYDKIKKHIKLWENS